MANSRSKKKSRKRKLRFRPTSSQIIAAAVFVLVLTYMVIRLLPDKTLFIYSEIYTYEADATAYIFKNEEYAVIESGAPIAFSIKEGDKVSGSTLLSETNSINSSKYITQKIKSIDYILNNQKELSKEKIYKEINAIDVRIAELNEEIDDSLMTNNEELKNSLLKELDENKAQKEVLTRSIQYVFTQVSDLKELKKRYTAMLSEGKMPLTLSNLNFSLFGNIYYSIDGYEDEMSFYKLENADADYFSYLSKLRPKGLSGSTGAYVIRSCSNDRMMIAVRVSKETGLSEQDYVLESKNKYSIRYDLETEGGYFEFLFRRIDLLLTYPELTLTFDDGISVNGYLVDVIESEYDKIAVLAVRSNIKRIQDKRIAPARLKTQRINAFIVPKSAVADADYAQYITVVKNSSKSTVKVKVYDYIDGKAILKVSDNPDLADAMQIMTKGKAPVD